MSQVRSLCSSINDVATAISGSMQILHVDVYLAATTDSEETEGRRKRVDTEKLSIEVCEAA